MQSPSSYRWRWISRETSSRILRCADWFEKKFPVIETGISSDETISPWRGMVTSDEVKRLKMFLFSNCVFVKSFLPVTREH